ncbi:hypothetical protein SAMN04487982_101368 [Streptomyces sp. ok210]|nr:hypothetical protein SAMN04487982_101368 [Streptomyces sp. ok210]
MFGLLLQVAKLIGQQVAQRQQIVRRGVLEHARDLLQRQPEGTQRPDPVQPPQITFGVAAVP